MSSRDWANWMDIVPKEFLEEYVPDEYKAFMETCERDDEDFKQIAHYLSYEAAEVSGPVSTAFDKLNDKFLEKSGLTLGMREIDSNNNDDAPEIEDGGHFILLDDMYVERPEVIALNNMGANISRWSYVSWG